MKQWDTSGPAKKAIGLRIYLMRHGETAESREGLLYGHTNANLSPTGVEQSYRLTMELSTRRLTAVYSSDLNRAALAARLIADAHGLTPRIVPDLREINMGDWESSTWGQIADAYPEMVSSLFTEPSTFVYPRGESFADFRVRVRRVLHSLLELHADGEIAVVTHGGVARLMIGEVLQLPPRNWLRLPQDFGCLNIMDVVDGQLAVNMMNYVPGQAGPAIRSSIR